jgi:hypothetical protein
MRRPYRLPLRAVSLAVLSILAGQSVTAAPGGGDPVYTWSTTDKNSYATLSNGNLTLTTTDSGEIYAASRAAAGHSTGKRAFEMSITGSSSAFGYYGAALLLATAGWDLTTQDMGSAECLQFYDAGDAYHELTGDYVTGLRTWQSGDKIYAYVDYDAGKVWFAINATISGDPVAGTGAALTFTPGTMLYPVGAMSASGYSFTANFGASDFAYDIPVGFSSWDGSQTGVATVYAWSTTDKASSIILTNSNLTASQQAGTAANTTATVRSTTGNSSGCVYVEINAGVGESSGTSNAEYAMLGLITGALGVNVIPGYSDPNSMAVWDDGYTVHNGVESQAHWNELYWNQGQTFMWFVDFGAGKAWAGRNGSWVGDPEAGTGQLYTFTPGTELFLSYTATFAPDGGVTAVTANFGASEFTYAIPRAGTTLAWDGSEPVRATVPVTWDSSKLTAGDTLSNGNLKVSTSNWDTYYNAVSTTSRTTGKVHIEFSVVSPFPATDDTMIVGLANTNFDPVNGNLSIAVGDGDTDLPYGCGFRGTGKACRFPDNAGIDTGKTWADGDVPMVEVDFDAGKAWVGTVARGWYGDPAAGTSPAFTFAPNTEFYAAVTMFSGDGSTAVSVTANFGASAFLSTPSAGFEMAWNGSTPAVAAVTWDANTDTGSIDLTGGNLTATQNDVAGSEATVFCTIGRAAGLFYFEGKIAHAELDNAEDFQFGLVASISGYPADTFVGAYNPSMGYGDSGQLYQNGAGGIGTAAGYSAGDYIGIAVNQTAGKAWVRTPAGWVGDPVAGTGASFTFTPGTLLYPAVSMYFLNESFTANFGGSGFHYAAPTGFLAWDGSEPTLAPVTLDPDHTTTGAALSNGNLRLYIPGGGYAHDFISRSTVSHTTGKWFFEVDAFYDDLGFSTACNVGFITNAFDTTNGSTYMGANAASWNWSDDGSYTHSNVNAAGGIGTWVTPRLAIDFDAGKMWFGDVAGWVNGGDPAVGTNPTYTFTPNTELWAAVDTYGPPYVQVNFGATAFVSAAPAGFLAWDGSEPTVAPVTWDANTKSAEISLTNGDLTASATASALTYGAKSTTSHTAGKFYMELSLHDAYGSSGYDVLFGFIHSDFDLSTNPGSLTEPAVFGTNGTEDDYHSYIGSTYGFPAGANDTWIGMAIDLDAGKGWFRNAAGEWLGGANPEAGSTPCLTFTPGTSMAAFLQTFGDGVNPSSVTGNFGASAFAHAIPVGFSSWDGNQSNVVWGIELQTTPHRFTLTDGDLTAVKTVSDFSDIRATLARSTGKYKIEVTVIDPAPGSYSMSFGFVSTSFALGPTNNSAWDSRAGALYCPDAGDTNLDGDSSAPVIANGGVAVMLIDLDAGKAWAGDGITWGQGGDPAAGTNPTFTFTPGDERVPMMTVYSDGSTSIGVTANFGATPFQFAAPAGYLSWNGTEAVQVSAWDSTTKSAEVTLTDDNLTGSVIPSPLYYGAKSTTYHTAGKFYIEFYIVDAFYNPGTADSNVEWGVIASDYNIADTASGVDGAGVDRAVLSDTNAARWTPSSGTPNVGRILSNAAWSGLAVDLDAGKAWPRNSDGTWLVDGDPVAGTGKHLSFTPGASMAVFMQTWGNDVDPSSVTVNLGASEFQFAAPTGFNAWDGSAPVRVATWAPEDKNSYAALSNGNLTLRINVDDSPVFAIARSTFGRSTGKFGFALINVPIAIPSDYDYGMGVATAAFDIENVYPGGLGSAAYIDNNDVYDDVSSTHASKSGPGAWAAGDNIYCFVDLDAGKGWFRRNGTYSSGANPATGASPDFTFTANTNLFPYGAVFYTTNSETANLGASTYPEAFPAGFLSWDGSPAVQTVAWDSLHKATEVTLTNGNLTASCIPSALNYNVRGTLARTSGLSYFEMQLVAEPYSFSAVMGVCNAAFDATSTAEEMGYDVGGNGWGVEDDGFLVHHPITFTDMGIPIGVGGWMGMAINQTSGKGWFRNAAGWSGDPVAGTGEAFTFAPGTALYPAAGLYGNDTLACTVTANFGATGFQFAAPTGYLAWDGSEPVQAATFDASLKHPSIVLSDGNLTASSSVHNAYASQSVGSTTTQTGGKFYVEAKLHDGFGANGYGCLFGLTNAAADFTGATNFAYDELATVAVTDAGDANYYDPAHADGAGAFFGPSGLPTPEADLTIANDTEWTALAVDLGAGKAWARNASGWLGGGDPVAGTGPYMTITTGVARRVFATLVVGDDNATASVTVNLGATSFAYTPPAGFSAWQS